MMTSVARTDARSRGFTLLEIIVVLSIAAVVLGGAAGLMLLSADDRKLRDASGEVELLAKRARMVAILQQIPYALEFRPGVVRMMPFAQAGKDDEKRTAGGRRIGGEVEENSYNGDHAETPLPDGMGASIRRWSSTRWLHPEDDNPIVWRFDPQGLNEPITIRFQTGESWQEDTYHPLTGTIADTRSEAQRGK